MQLMRRYVLRDSQLDSELEPFAVTFLNDVQKEMRDSTSESVSLVFPPRCLLF
jgi:hypothetical protein